MNAKGSYKIEEMKNSQEELKRIENQANFMQQFEGNVLKGLGLKNDSSVLEVGCGPGFITTLLCQIAKDGKVFAADTDEHLLELCKKNVTTSPIGGLKVFNPMKESMDFLENKIDFSYLRFVLQHVPDPQGILMSAYKSLKSGGILCALDSDDGLIIQEPEDSFLSKIVQEAQSIQKTKGGDRKIGRKMHSYFKKLGLVEVKTKILNFTHNDIPFPMLAKILLGYKSQLSGQNDQIDNWIQNKTKEIELGEYFLSAGVVLTTGKKV